MIKKFEINKTRIKEEFLKEENKAKREWLFSIFSEKKLEKFKKKYYKYLKKKEENIPYFKIRK